MDQNISPTNTQTKPNQHPYPLSSCSLVYLDLALKDVVGGEVDTLQVHGSDLAHRSVE